MRSQRCDEKRKLEFSWSMLLELGRSEGEGEHALPVDAFLEAVCDFVPQTTRSYSVRPGGRIAAKYQNIQRS